MKILLMRIPSPYASRNRDAKWYEYPVLPSMYSSGDSSAPYPPREETPLEWNANGCAEGKIRDLISMRYDFEVRFRAHPLELRNWLKSYVTAKPEEALRLLAEMQAEATISLAQKAKRDVLDEIERS